MATVQINLSSSTARIQQQPVADSHPIGGDTITSSGSSQQGTTVAASNPGYDIYWSVTSSGGSVWVTFGSNPTAAPGTSWLIPDGQTFWLRAVPGDIAAVIDAS